MIQSFQSFVLHPLQHQQTNPTDEKKRFHSLSLFRNTLKMNPRSVVLSTPFFTNTSFEEGGWEGGVEAM